MNPTTSLPIPPATAPRKAPRDPWGLGEIIDRLGPSMLVGLLMTDGTLIHANRAALDIAGVQLVDVLGLPFEQTVWWREAPQVQCRLREAIEAAAEGRSSRFELEIVTVQGESKTIDFSLQPVFDVEGRVAFLVPSGFDVSEARAAQAHALFLIEHDPLTGLPNRRALPRHLAVKMERARQEQRRLAALCIDVDRFSQVNALLGSEGGDEVLRAVVERIQSCLDPHDTLARIGGDEFVVVLGPDTSTDEAAAQIAVTVLDAVAAPMEVHGQEVIVTASVGVGSIDPATADGEKLLSNAGIALDRARAMGRNAYFVHAPERCPADSDRVVLEAALHHAQHRKELSLVYQPQADLSTGEIVGIEALLRWTHPLHGPIAPDRFIPLAEETGLIGPIGDWVIRHAAATAAAWQRAGLPPVRLSVNVSAAQLQQPRFADRLLRMLEHAGLEPRRFGVELTESLIMHRLDEAVEQLRRLRSSGVEVSLDDFGTGYSSLSCLRRLPIDVVKLDRSLVPALTAGSEAMSVARAIIAIAHSFGMKTLAEGVENEGQLEWLVASRCDRIQGYHFSKPCSGDDMEAMLRSGRRLALSERRREARVRSVLIVDDEAWAREKLAQQLRWRFDETVRLDTCANAGEALVRLAEKPYDVVVSDLRMSGTDGVALLHRLRHLQPHAVRMMLAAPADVARLMEDGRQIDVFRYLPKPWSAELLLPHFEAALREVDRRRGQLALGGALQSEADRLTAAELELREIEAQEPGITSAARGPLDEGELPTHLLTLPGDLWNSTPRNQESSAR